MGKWRRDILQRRLGALVPAQAAERLTIACHAFRDSLSLVGVAREHHAAVDSAVEKLESAVRAYEVMLGRHGAEIYGLPKPDTPPERATLTLMRRDLRELREQQQSWAAGGRPAEYGTAGLVRALVAVLRHFQVPERLHQRVIGLCFEEMGHACNAKGYLYRARQARRAERQ